MPRIKDNPHAPVNAETDVVAQAIAAARPDAGPSLARDVRMNALLGAVLGAAPPPITIGRWTLERPIGAGGMGVVYRARDPEGQVVALKLLNRELHHARARFEREAALLRRVEHPYVVRYIDHGSTPDGQDYLVMEWLDGEDLAARLRRGTLTVDEALTRMIEAARGLGAIHRAGVIHRDVKPANLFLSGGEVRVVDFGVAQDPSSSRLTTTGTVHGTTPYMAPEQLQGSPGICTDVYALGACLYECLAGAPPFQGETPGAVILQILSGTWPSLTARRPDVPPAVEALVGRMMARDPAQRPPDMDAVALALAELLTGQGPAVAVSQAERPPSQPTPVRAAPGALVGRSRELGQLRGLLSHAIEEEQAVFVVITGAPGVGRTALLQAASGEPWAGQVRVARCAPEEAGVPFALLRRLLPDADWLDARTGDPLQVADRLRLAWLAVVDGWRQAPTALFIDDLHLADLSSLRFLALTRSRLGDRPFALVASSGTDGVPAFLRDDPATVSIPLGPLGERAIAQLAARWSIARPDVLALCGGNPGELLRLARHEAPARLDALSPALRRVARACALVGRTIWTEAVAVLLGVTDDGALEADFAALTAEGLIEGAGAERIFTSEAAWAATLAICTDADRRRGAQAMARWLNGRRRPADRGWHLLFLGERAEATACFLEAARQAVAGEDDALVERLLDAAGQAATPEQQAEVALFRAQVAFWRGRIGEAATAALIATDALPVGGRLWLEAASLGITALGQQADHHGLRRIVERVSALETVAVPDARIIALCRAITQLAAVEPAEIGPLCDVALQAPATSAEAQAWQARARSAIWATRSFDEAIACLVDAHRAHLLAGDPRAAAQIGLYLGSYYVWSGAWERAEAVITDALSTAQRLGASYLELWGRYTWGKLQVEIGAPEAALLLLEQVASAAQGSPRIQAGAWIYASMAALRAGQLTRAATLAAAAQAHPGVARAAQAARCRALVAIGDDAELRALSSGLITDQAARIIEWDELVYLAAIEVQQALGADPAPLVRAALDRIGARADTLADPLRRNEYLSRPHIVAQLLALSSVADIETSG